MSFFKKIKNSFSSELNKKILNHGFWVLSGNIISKFILLVSTILMARYLGKIEYGQFGIIKSTILMFALFAGLELGITSTKYISQYKTTNNEKVIKIVGLSNLFAITISLLVAALVFIFSKFIAQQINAPELYVEIRISSLILFFSSLNGVQNGILAGLERFKELSINNVIAGVASSILLIIASMYFELWVVVFAFGSNFLIIFLLNFVTLRRIFYNEFSINVFDKKNFEELHVLWRFTLPAILAGLMVGPVVWFGNYLLVNQPKGYDQMANFDIANQWRNTILFIPAALAQITLPLLSSSVNKKMEYNDILNKNLKINIYLSSLLVIVFVALSPLIIKLYGYKYDDSLYPLIIMFITTAFISINNVLGQAIASKDRMWLGFIVNLIWGIVFIGLTFLFVRFYHWGALGLSFAYLISYIIHSVIQFFIIKRQL